MRPSRAKWVQEPLFFRTLGALEPIQETMTAEGPCTFSQKAVKDKEPVGLGCLGPFQQGIRRSTAQRAGPPAGCAPLALIGPEPFPVLRRLDVSVGPLQLEMRPRVEREPGRP